MNPKLPIISGREAIKAFQKIRYEVVRQTFMGGVINES